MRAGVSRRLVVAALAAVLAVLGGAVAAPTAAFAAAPKAVDDSYSVRANSVIGISDGRGVVNNDIDVPADAKVRLVSDVNSGTVALLPSGWFTYHPDPDFVGYDYFVYCMVDPAVDKCLFPQANVVITVTAVDRISGGDRYATSAELSASAFTAGTRMGTVYVASGEGFPDALSASSAAGVRGAPVLLTPKNSVPAAIDAELTRLKPDRIVLVGGAQTISSSVEATLKTYGATEVVRVAGADRYAVSAESSRTVFAPGRSVVYVASGEKFPDALTGAAAGGMQGAPVLLTPKNMLPSAVEAELQRLTPARIVILGGVDSVSGSVSDALTTIAPTTRIDGADRYEVSAKLSQAVFLRASTKTIYVASGEVFADALSSSAVAISQAEPVLLVTRDRLPAAVAAELDRLNPGRIVVVGGSGTISDAVKHELESYLP